MTKYTPEPWSEGQKGNLRLYGLDGMGRHSGMIAEFLRREDLRRVRICVNACVGIPTAALEGADVKALVDGTQGLLGLLQLLASRDDLPPAVQSILGGNHWRITEANAALAPFLKGDDNARG